MSRASVLVFMLILMMLTTACGGEDEAAQRVESDTQEATSLEETVDQPSEEIKVDESKIVMAVGEYAPYISESLPEYGFVAAIVKESYANVGVEVEFEFYPWSRAMQMAQDSVVVGSFPWTMNEERSEFFNITTKFVSEKTSFIYLEGNSNMPADFNSADSLKNARVTAVQDYSYVALLEEQEIKFDISNNEKEAIAKMMADRVDTFPTNPLVAMEIIKSDFPDRAKDVKFLKTPLAEIELVF